MSLAKRELEEREAAWDRKARAEHLLCSVCSQHITYADREVFFRSKMCGSCAHQSEKDD